MSTGPGAYAPEALELLQRLEARGVLLIVIEGPRGSGLNVAVKDVDCAKYLPVMLEEVLPQLRDDVEEV